MVQFGDQICEGKTKIVYKSVEDNGEVIIVSKDDITAGDGAKKDILEGKAGYSTTTTCNIFRLLHLSSIPTHFIKQETTESFRALSCDMIPVEVIVRRIATGSYIKRHPEIKEGFQFQNPLVEFTFKSDELHDPLISDQELLDKSLVHGGLLVDEGTIKRMKEMASSAFTTLETAWQLQSVTLVDFKVEFGVTLEGHLVLADVIDNDSWRIWPGGDKAMMKDKQVYRNMVGALSAEGRSKLIENYSWTAEKSAYLIDSLVKQQTNGGPLVGVIMGSQSDWETMKNACNKLQELGVPFETRIVSAHRTPERLFAYSKSAKSRGLKVIIAGAGGAAHLPGMVAALTPLPVLGVPIQSRALSGMDSLLSIVQMPSGVPVGSLAIGTSGAINAGILAASMLAASGKYPNISKQLDLFRAEQTELVAEFPVETEQPPVLKHILAEAPKSQHFPSKQLAPGSTIGIVGGGQLAKMISVAAAQLGYKCHIYCPDQHSPAFQICYDKTIAEYTDQKALSMFAAKVDVITYEFENIPFETLRFMGKWAPIRPSPEVLAICQNRLREKTFCKDIGVATTKFESIESEKELEEKIRKVGFPAVLKSNTFGYDGKGQVILKHEADLSEAWNKLQSMKSAEAILEAFVDFELEVSVIVCRGFDGKMTTFPVVENRHQNHILRETIVPAQISDQLQEAARQAALSIAKNIGLVGIIAVEMFVTKDGRVLVNEMAPRPHNSGHWSIEGCSTSQFEQLVRTICGLPLGSTKMLAKKAVMQNLLGEEVNGWAGYLTDESALLSALHIYGKTAPSPGRKMGHITKLFEA